MGHHWMHWRCHDWQGGAWQGLTCTKCGSWMNTSSRPQDAGWCKPPEGVVPLTWATVSPETREDYLRVHGASAPQAWLLDYIELELERAGYIKQAGEWVARPKGAVLQPDGSWKVPS